MAKATSMAELMARTSSSIKSFKKGEETEGTITKLTKSEILIDIGAKTEALVLEKDKTNLKNIISSLKVGDKVFVTVLNPESDQGNPVVSLRRFIEKRQWEALEKLKNDKTPVDVIAQGSTKGGFLVTTEAGISGFLPISQTNLSESTQNIIGKKIKALVIDVNRTSQKVIFSQKAAIGDEDFDNAVGMFKNGQIVDAKVAGTTSFGIFVSIKNTEGHQPGGLPGPEGFIHLSELSWDRLESAENFLKVGEEIKAQVVDIDKKAKRINLSIKRLTQDPFEKTASKFAADTKVAASIKQIGSIGIVLDLGEGIDGIIKKEKIPPTASYSVGDRIEATVSEVDLKRRRIVLTPVLKDKPIGYR